MNYLKITKYIYLAIGFVMVYDAASNWKNEPKPWLSVILAGLAFFMFFFRNRFDKKFTARNNQNNPNNQSNP